MVGILGDIDPEMMNSGRYTHRFFTKDKILYDRLADGERSLVYIFPKKTTLKHRLGTDDELFVDFVGEDTLASFSPYPGNSPFLTSQYIFFPPRWNIITIPD